jgi:hypothetical protein
MKYKILTKTKKFYWTIDSLYFTVTGVTIGLFFIKLMILGEEVATIIDKFLLSILLIMHIVTLIYGFYKFNKYVTLKGELLYDLEFQKDKIIISNKEYYLDTIEKLEITAFDFKGLRTGNKSFDGSLSNGVDNILKLYLKDNNKIEINFQQKTKNEIRNEELILIHYTNMKKLHYLTLLDIFGINDYDEIQKYKKEKLTIFS